MYTEDWYFLVPAPDLVGTRVLLSVFIYFFTFFRLFFYLFVTWMVFECLPKCNDYKLNNKLCDLTSQIRNRVPLPRWCSL